MAEVDRGLQIVICETDYVHSSENAPGDAPESIRKATPPNSLFDSKVVRLAQYTIQALAILK